MAIKTAKLSNNSVIGISIAVTVVTLIVLFGTGRSFYSRITHNARVITAKQTAKKQLDTNLANLPLLAQSYQGLGATQTLAQQALPDTTDFPSLVASMEVIAGASNVGLSAVSPTAVSATTAVPAATATSPGSESTTPQPYGFSVSIKGPYSGILTFIQNLQLSARPIRITDMQFSGTTSSLTGTISAQTYYYSPQILIDKTEVVK